VANLRNNFRKIMARGFLTELLAATHPPLKKPRLAARKIARNPAAFGLPQDSHPELMFGAARFGEPASSISRGLDFTSHRDDIVRRSALGTPRKCFYRHRIFGTTGRRAA
jgi:hypothetical protein